MAGDVTEPGAAEQAVEEICRRFGTLDVLLKNVGCMASSSACDGSDAEWDRVFAANVTTLDGFSDAALRPMTLGRAVIKVVSDWALVVAKGALP